MRKVKVDSATQKAMDKAKISLIRTKNSAFISTILFSLKLGWTEDHPTACTDGLELWINPKFFNSLTKGNQVFLLAHEAEVLFDGFATKMIHSERQKMPS